MGLVDLGFLKMTTKTRIVLVHRAILKLRTKSFMALVDLGCLDRSLTSSMVLVDSGWLKRTWMYWMILVHFHFPMTPKVSKTVTMVSRLLPFSQDIEIPRAWTGFGMLKNAGEIGTSDHIRHVLVQLGFQWTLNPQKDFAWSLVFCFLIGTLQTLKIWRHGRDCWTWAAELRNWENKSCPLGLAFEMVKNACYDSGGVGISV